MGSMSLIFIPASVRHLLGTLGLSERMTSTFGLTATPNNSIGRHNPPLAAHLPHFLPPVHLLTQSVILQ